MTRPANTSPHAGGDRLLETFELAAPNLLRFLIRRVEPPEDAADVLAEVFVVAWRRRRQLPTEPDQLAGWLYGTARLVTQNHQRTSHRAAKLAERLRLELSASTVAVEDHAESVAETDRIHRALLTLPPQNAELVRLVHWEGLTVAAAAVALKVSPSTARSRYQSARAKLRDLLITDLHDARP